MSGSIWYANDITAICAGNAANSRLFFSNRVLRMEIGMARPQTKNDLIAAAELNYDKLLELIESMTESELNTEFDFSADPKKKEAHWRRDKNLRDILIHLHEWHNLMLQWLANNKAGNRKPFLMEGYNWKTYGEMNVIFWKRNQTVSLEDSLEQFQESHKKIMSEIEKMTNDELFQKNVYDWVGGSTLGSYFISVTSSHYDWAMKKMKAHRKMVNGK